MSNIDKQALREEFRNMQDHYSDPADRERQEIYIAAEAVLDELESKQTFQQAFFRQSLMYDVVAEAYEEAKEQIAKDVEIKARLCLESNSLFDRLRAAEKRIAELDQRLIEYAGIATREAHRVAELEARKVNLSKLSVGEVMHMSGFSRDYAEGWCAGNDNAIHEIRTAGIKVKES
ncbi:ead/Ea22-like family protein [Salmonella enterica]